MIIKFIFKLHILLFKYPCRSHVRMAIEKSPHTSSLPWRVGMLFVCGETIESISDWVYLEKKEVLLILNKLAKEITT